MRPDEILDDFRKIILLGYFYPVGHMAYHYLRALHIVQGRMRVHPVLVFGKECRILHLAYVMIQRPCPDELRVGSYAVGRSGSKIGHLHGVLECAGRGFRQFPEQFVVDIG